ncbi:hypothetical protein JNW90_26095 [Micromonospora sp. STR1s_5]|nr:hypothetical protein [Micromonospora sp. STR1s_5]
MTFTVIEGGGKRDERDFRLAVQEFTRFLMEVLRGTARGDDHGARVTTALVRFVKRADGVDRPLWTIVHQALTEAFSTALEIDFEDDASRKSDDKMVMRSALQTLAETLAIDPAAGGRRSQRERDFRNAIEQTIIESERRSRENGWSFVQNLTERLGP